jgi:hypothetical protein
MKLRGACTYTQAQVCSEDARALCRALVSAWMLYTAVHVCKMRWLQEALRASQQAPVFHVYSKVVSQGRCLKCKRGPPACRSTLSECRDASEHTQHASHHSPLARRSAVQRAGQCEYPWEFPSYGRFGCEADCGRDGNTTRIAVNVRAQRAWRSCAAFSDPDAILWARPCLFS